MNFSVHTNSTLEMKYICKQNMNPDLCTLFPVIINASIFQINTVNFWQDFDHRSVDLASLFWRLIGQALVFKDSSIDMFHHIKWSANNTEIEFKGHVILK